jgi:hypothetical protein
MVMIVTTPRKPRPFLKVEISASTYQRLWELGNLLRMDPSDLMLKGIQTVTGLGQDHLPLSEVSCREMARQWGELAYDLNAVLVALCEEEIKYPEIDFRLVERIRDFARKAEKELVELTPNIEKIREIHVQLPD